MHNFRILPRKGNFATEPAYSQAEATIPSWRSTASCFRRDTFPHGQWRRCGPQVRPWVRWGHGCPSSQEAACGGPPLAYFEPVAGAEELGAGADEEGAGVEVVGAGALLGFAGVVVLEAGATAACVWAGRHSVALFFISHSTLRSLSRRPSPTLT